MARRFFASSSPEYQTLRRCPTALEAVWGIRRPTSVVGRRMALREIAGRGQGYEKLGNVVIRTGRIQLDEDI